MSWAKIQELQTTSDHGGMFINELTCVWGIFICENPEVDALCQKGEGSDP